MGGASLDTGQTCSGRSATPSRACTCTCGDSKGSDRAEQADASWLVQAPRMASSGCVFVSRDVEFKACILSCGRVVAIQASWLWAEETVKLLAQCTLRRCLKLD